MLRLHFVCCFVLLVTSRSSIAADGIPSWDEIRDRYLSNVESVATLDITADLTFGMIDREGKRIGPGETGDLGNGAVSGTKLSLHWVKDGSKEFIHVAPMLQVPPDPVCMFTDGAHAYQLNFRGKDCLAILKTAKTASIEWEMRGVNGANPLLECLGWNTIAVVARQVTPRSIESDTLDGIPCWKVDLGECGFPSTDGIPFDWHVTAWFQANAVGNPIRIDSQGVKYKAVTRQVHVQSFSQQGDLWLPESFELVAGSTSGHFTTGKILTAKLNEPVSSSVFSVPTEYKTSDTVNIDSKSDVRRQEKKRNDADGTTARVKSEIERIGRQAEENAKAMATPTSVEPGEVVANPQQQGGLVLWLAVAGIVLLCGGTVLAFRRS